MDLGFRNIFKRDFREIGYLKAPDFVVLAYGLVGTSLVLYGHSLGSWEAIHTSHSFLNYIHLFWSLYPPLFNFFEGYMLLWVFWSFFEPFLILSLIALPCLVFSMKINSFKRSLGLIRKLSLGLIPLLVHGLFQTLISFLNLDVNLNFSLLIISNAVPVLFGVWAIYVWKTGLEVLFDFTLQKTLVCLSFPILLVFGKIFFSIGTLFSLLDYISFLDLVWVWRILFSLWVILFLLGLLKFRLNR